MPFGRSFFCITKHDAEEDGEQCGDQNASLLDSVVDGDYARQRHILFHLTLLAFMELAEDGEKFVGDSQGAPGFSTVHHG